ncbi:MAG TPA: J domain-containing protein [Stellaceae bacterium]|nr:J domain-containing protein [Stellaceae bacterium]
MRPCDYPGCCAGGDFPAPRSRGEPDRYHWFCLEHVRAYNAAWNYYAGMSEGEIEAEIRRDTVWQRPSWRFGLNPYAGRVRDPFGFVAGAAGPEAHSRGRRQTRPSGPLSAREQALAVFDLEPPITPGRLKARYKALVKEHHPDTHGGDKAAEEKLKIINQAYATLKASLLT